METTNKTTSLKPPVVAVLGHVDHGKTTLLDYLRNSRIVSREAGGITQHIGAYQVDHQGRAITFIDTPGHEAFINLRARGATASDIALLVIDASESVKPQTVESIKIIQKANIPLIIALNKMDLKTANSKKVSQDLLRYNVVTEEQGGNIVSVPISAKTGKGIPDLLDALLLVAELKKINASDDAPLDAVVIESRKDTFKGTTATVIVQNGTVGIGDTVWVDERQEKVRALFDDRGKAVKKALPGMPVEVLGFSKPPQVGSRVTHTLGMPRAETTTSHARPAGEGILSIMLKADTHGSLEAVTAGLPPEVTVVTIGIGEVTEGDVTQAKSQDLVIIGFNIGVRKRVQKFADDERVRIRVYPVIYKLFEEMAEVVDMLKEGPRKDIIGQAKILQEFKTSEGVVAGCQVTEGRIARGDTLQIARGKALIAERVRIASLRQQKEEVGKVEKGKLCGILFSGRVDFRIGDMIQSYTLYEL